MCLYDITRIRGGMKTSTNVRKLKEDTNELELGLGKALSCQILTSVYSYYIYLLMFIINN